MTHIDAHAEISHGHLNLVAKPVNARIVVTGRLGNYPLLNVLLDDATAARALAQQLVAAADAVERHWQPDAVAEQPADEAPVLDTNGNPVPLKRGEHATDGLRSFMAGRVPAADCEHYIAASEAKAGYTRCEQCGEADDQLLETRHG